MSAHWIVIFVLVLFAIVTGGMGVLSRTGKLSGHYTTQYGWNHPIDEDKISAFLSNSFFLLSVAFAIGAMIMVVLHST